MFFELAQISRSFTLYFIQNLTSDMSKKQQQQHTNHVIKGPSMEALYFYVSTNFNFFLVSYNNFIDER